MAKLDKRGLFQQIGYDPHPGQLAVHEATASRRIVACGSRWGKSTVAAVEALCALLAPTAPSRGWLVAPTYDLADQLLAGVLQYVEAHLAHRVIESAPRARKLVLRNLAGNVALLECRSCERPANLVGAGLDWLVIDEAARVKDEHWSTALSQRLADRGGWLLACSTPRGCHGWFFDAYVRGREGDTDYAAWSRPTAENPRVDPALLAKERERLSREAYFQEYEGEFIPEHGRCCPTCEGPRVDGAASVLLVEPEDDIVLCTECSGPTFKGVAVGYPGPGGLCLKVIDLREVTPPQSVALALARASR
jgi:hypothetical protein